MDKTYDRYLGKPGLMYEIWSIPLEKMFLGCKEIIRSVGTLEIFQSLVVIIKMKNNEKDHFYEGKSNIQYDSNFNDKTRS